MKIHEAYNEWSQQYDSNENKTRDLDKKATIDVLSNYNFTNVLELGCGTGKNTEWLLSNGASVTALDFSEGMLEQARKKIKNPKASFLPCDLIKKWNVPDHTFDLVCCNLVLEHIENLDHIFGEALLKLKANGLFFISELNLTDNTRAAKQDTKQQAAQTNWKFSFIICLNSLPPRQRIILLLNR